jgi:hypothetical protein
MVSSHAGTRIAKTPMAALTCRCGFHYYIRPCPLAPHTRHVTIPLSACLRQLFIVSLPGTQDPWRTPPRPVPLPFTALRVIMYIMPGRGEDRKGEVTSLGNKVKSKGGKKRTRGLCLLAVGSPFSFAANNCISLKI